MFEQYISELLYKYDSIILPGFGAFVLKYIPASIHHIENKLSPPSKIILFDASQNLNDGILANHISEKKRISFIEANSEILAFVNEINKNLSANKPVILQKIGRFTKSADNNISFTPDITTNYNLETFGLDEIVSAPIIRDDIKERLQKQFSENKRTAKQKKGLSKAAIWITIIFVVLCGSIGTFIIIKPAFIHNISFFNSSEKNKEIIGKEKIIIQKDSDKNKNISSANTVKTDTPAANENLSETKSIDNKNGEKYFYIISATFRVKENAEKYAASLKEKAYDPQLIFLEDKKLYAVSYNSFSAQSEAKQALSKINSSENPNAWILYH